MTNLRSVFFGGGRHLLIHTLKAFRPVKLPVKIGVPKTSKCFVLHFLSLPAPLRRGFLLVERQKKRPLVSGGPASFALESALGVLAGEVEAEGEYPDAGKRCENPSRHFSILQVSL